MMRLLWNVNPARFIKHEFSIIVDVAVVGRVSNAGYDVRCPPVSWKSESTAAS